MAGAFSLQTHFDSMAGPTLLHILACAATSAAVHVQVDIRAGAVKSRGVNLGGWLVAEHWMTADAGIWNGLPGDVTGQGEYAVMQALGPYEGNARFKRHWDTFITEDDIKQIASAAKLNTVRVPVGYWIQGCGHLTGAQWEYCNMFPKGGLEYLDTLIRSWAKTHNVAVLVSLHGAPGSQNGQDHSGAISPEICWAKYRENVVATRTFARFLAARYANDVAFLGLGLLNEPVPGYTAANPGVDFATLSQYYHDVVADIRAISTDMLVVTAPLLYNQGPGPAAENMESFEPSMTHAWHDWHPYVIWGYGDLSERELITAAGKRKADVVAWKGKPLFLGEWSLVTPGASFSDMSSPLFQQFATTYLGMLHEAKGGWTYWSWKKSGDDVGSRYDKWSLRSMLNLANSVRPSPRARTLLDNARSCRSILTSSMRLPSTAATDKNGRASEWWYNPTTKTLRSNRDDGPCLTAVHSAYVQGWACGSGRVQQQWLVDSDRIRLAGTFPPLCLASNLTLSPCVGNEPTQRFAIGRQHVAIKRRHGPSVWFRAAAGQVAAVSAPPPEWIIDHGKLTVQDAATGMCLDAFRTDGNVHLFECSDENVNQKWLYDARTAQLRHATHVGFCLDVFDRLDGTMGSHLYGCHDVDDVDIWNQQFDLVPTKITSPAAA
ncbi:hypothetical protein DYB32_008660 [Aphanomyces invadans]|uniref:glucan 1,3-beta-glucosidase n=1 Tax=Aphanomyces invadans TaxID=157072 RepID=A0A418AKG5_9STRA|nr:hypothetical protein DYB32_008660 [Aphanomyces invadans]